MSVTAISHKLDTQLAALPDRDRSAVDRHLRRQREPFHDRRWFSTFTACFLERFGEPLLGGGEGAGDHLQNLDLTAEHLRGESLPGSTGQDTAGEVGGDRIRRIESDDERRNLRGGLADRGAESRWDHHGGREATARHFTIRGGHVVAVDLDQIDSAARFPNRQLQRSRRRAAPGGAAPARVAAAGGGGNSHQDIYNLLSNLNSMASSMASSIVNQ